MDLLELFGTVGLDLDLTGELVVTRVGHRVPNARYWAHLESGPVPLHINITAVLD